jgi:C_GCAxxG_C_C family probable redox protein
MKSSEHGEALFTKGLNCAQSVFSSLLENTGLGQGEASRIASAFGGGILDMEKTCGAVTGALMALGLKFGTASPHEYEKKTALKEKAGEFLRRFENEFGSLDCEYLRNQFPDPSDPHSNCQIYVGKAIELVEEISCRGNE